MHGTYDDRPPHQRLDGMSVRHLNNVLKHLCGGSIGFDTSRDERTNTKEKLAAYIVNMFPANRIDDAHNAVRATYGDGHSFQSRRQSRRRWQNHGNAAQSSEQSATHTSATSQAYDAAQERRAAESAAQKAKFDSYDYAAENVTRETAIASGNAIAGTFPPPAGAGDMSAKLAAILAEILNAKSTQIDAAQVNAIVDGRISAAVETLKDQISAASGAPRVVELRQAELPPINVGIQHHKFETLLRACNARLRDGHRLNVWLAGPAGTGKTTAAKMVAKALGLAFHFNGAVDSPYKLSGFIDANGRCIRTPFREAYEHGGVYLFDEIDASSPSAILEFNAPLANGAYAFPDKIIERHPDCVIIAGANTTGLGGGTLEYVGRMRQDAALLDRFCFISWQLDEALEGALCANAEWHKRVTWVRNNVRARGLKGVLVTPRATMYGEALLAAGLDQSDVENMVLRKGMDDSQWGMVR